VSRDPAPPPAAIRVGDEPGPKPTQGHPPPMKHAVVPPSLLAKVELLLRQIGLVEQLPGEGAGSLYRHDKRNL
jgi:hypothetical protein